MRTPTLESQHATAKRNYDGAVARGDTREAHRAQAEMSALLHRIMKRDRRKRAGQFAHLAQQLGKPAGRFQRGMM